MKKLYALFHLYALLVVLTFTGWFMACEEKEDFIPLKIFSVEPVEFLIGDTILITGEGFSPGLEYNQVFFPSVGASVKPLSNSNEKNLWVKVPEGATPGPVVVNLFDEEVAESPEALSIKVPVIESVEPAEGAIGDTIIIRGQNFRPAYGENTVRFSSQGLAAVLRGSQTELRVIVPVGARPGPVGVLGFDGPAFTVFPSSITGIEPLQGVVGDTISILGWGFGVSQGTSVQFGGSGVNTSSPVLLNGSTSKKLRVVVPENARDGKLTINYSTTNIASEQVFEVYPSITGITPKQGISNTDVTINGFGFSNTRSANKIYFGSLEATVADASEKQLKVKAPEYVESGPVIVTVNGRTTIGPAFELVADGTPLVFSINPVSGPVGTTVTLTGDFFSNTPAENIVHFENKVQAQVLSASTRELRVKVPVGAVTGPIKVTKEGKEGTGPDFTISARANPTVREVKPFPVMPDTDFTIDGDNFTTFPEDITIRVLEAGISFKALSATSTEEPTSSAEQLTARMPADAPAGEYPIQVEQYGTGSSTIDKTITIGGLPQITSLSVSEGTVGISIVLTGKNFHNIDIKNTVKFGSKEATVTPQTDFTQRDKITVTVPDLPRGQYNITVTAFDNVSDPVPFKVKGAPVAVKNVFYARKLTSPAEVWVEKAYYDGETAKALPIFKSPSSTIFVIKSLVVDIAGNRAYFFSDGTSSLYWSSLDGTSSGTVFSSLSINSANSDLTLNATDNMLYWSAVKNLQKGSTSGGTFTTMHTAPGNLVRGLSYATTGDHLYFCENRTSPTRTRIARISADASIGVDTTTTTLISRTPHVAVDVKVDRANKKIFILCGEGTSTTARRRILVADLDAAGLVVPGSLTDFINMQSGTGAELNANINGIALDTKDQYLYWIKHTTETTTVRPSGVYRKRYDGGTIPGTEPATDVELVYPVSDLSIPSQNIIGGLSIEEESGVSGSGVQRKRSSQRSFSPSLSLEFVNYERE